MEFVLILQSWMDAYFDRIKKYQLNSELPSRIRFMLQDVVELRDNNVGVTDIYQ